MKSTPLIKHIVSLLLFGMNGIVASLIALSSMQIVLLRTLLGSALLITIFLLGGGTFSFYKYKRDLMYLLISGVAMGTSWMFLYEAFVRIGVSIATLLYSCGPVIVMALSPLLFKEKLTVWNVSGFGAVLCGVVLLNGQLILGDGDVFGLVCGLLSALTYAFMVIFNKKATSITGLENSSLQLLISFVTVAIIVGISDSFEMDINLGNIVPILILGLINTGVGCYLYFSSINGLKVQTVAICGYLEPLSAVVFSFCFLNERMSAGQIIGAVLILGGAIFAELFKGFDKSKYIKGVKDEH